MATKLFDSNEADVIDTHFRWMSEYGIDGAAIQRFVGGLTGRCITKTTAGTQLNKIKNAAEKNGKLLYIMYDISGGSQITDTSDTTSISSYVKDMKFDWVYNIEQSQELLNSDAYATVDGKPVVCIWGFGFSNSENTRPNRRADYEEIIRFFQARGCYVSIGVPREWRQQSQYLDIYNKADMITPWYVGALGDESGVDNIYANYLQPDVQYCKNIGQDYYPVVFSGFSWTLWQGGKPNMIPRNAGQLFWYQAYKLKQLGINAFYIAMFDEYDDGTANGKLNYDITGYEDRDSYVMTMLFASGNAAEFTANWAVRAYAKLADGSYVYSDVAKYTIYDIAKILYEGTKMNTKSAHDYLYTDILTVVDANYKEVDYNWSCIIVK